jgi:hypothetical protein
MDGFKVFSETGSIGEALIAGLGGVLSFLTFGLFDAETVKNVVNAVSGFVTEYIVEPITKFFNFLGDSFNTYIKEPVMAAFDSVAGLFDEFIVQPLKTVFEPVTKFFSNLKDTIFGWFESFEIPGINFSVMGKQFGFGPWRPFKSDSAAAPAQAASSSTTPAAPADKSSVSAATPAAKTGAMDNSYDNFITANPNTTVTREQFNAKKQGTAGADKAPVSAATVVTAPAQATPVGVQNNGKTPTDISTKSESYTKIAGERVVPGQQLSEKQMAVIGMSKSMGNSYSPEIEKQYKTQSAAIDSAKISPAASPQSGNAVAKGSEQNKEANMDASKPNSGGGNTIVSAPTVNNVQNTQQTIKLQPRNRDNSVSNYLSSRYAF